jgi:hypothetical protein
MWPPLGQNTSPLAGGWPGRYGALGPLEKHPAAGSRVTEPPALITLLEGGQGTEAVEAWADVARSRPVSEKRIKTSLAAGYSRPQ